MIDDRVPELQRNVQRLLGRCLLRIQQYERRMKALLAVRADLRPGDDPDALHDARLGRLANKSLGTLVRQLFDEGVVAEAGDRKPSDGEPPTDGVWMSIGFELSLEPQRFAELRAALAELVKVRNDLVHHLIDRFDLWSEDGCVAAARHLEESYERVERHLAELRAWIDSVNEAWSIMASHSAAFRDLVLDGIGPDGSFEWSDCGIVRALREAAEAVSENGWTRLDRAREWIESTLPDQTPGKYGCRTWPQVLGESRLFDLTYRREPDGRKIAWFRVRPAGKRSASGPRRHVAVPSISAPQT